MSFALPLPLVSEHPAFGGQSQPWETFSIDNFSGGLCTAFPESHIADNQFTQLMNYYHVKDGSLKARGPYRPYSSAAAEDTVLPYAPLSFKWVKLGTSEFLVASWDAGSTTTVSVWDSANDRWAGTGGGTAIKTGLDDDYIVEFVKFSINEAEDLIFCNGKDTPQRVVLSSGTIVDEASSDLGLAIPTIGTPTLQGESKVASGPGISVTADFYYKFTAFYDSSGTNTKYGESGPTAACTIAIAGADGTPSAPTIEDCPDIPSGATKCYVYRSPAGETNGPYRRVGYYIDATEAEFVDNLDVGAEGVEIPADAGTPPKLKHPLVFKGRIWGIGLTADAELANKLVYSETGYPDVFPAANFAYFPNDLIGAIPFKEDLYIFTKKQIYIIPQGDVITYPEPLKICDRGATSFQSIVDVGNGLVFQGEDNIYWADFNTRAKDGDFPIPIGEPIKDKIESIYISTDYRHQSRAYLHRNKYYLCYTPQNQTLNTATLVWDVEVGTWLLHQGRSGAWSSLDWDANDIQDFDGTLYTADNTNKYIQEHDFAGEDDFYTYTEYAASTSHNIETSLATKRFHFGQEASDKIVRSLSLVTESSGVSISAVLDVNTTDFIKPITSNFGTDSVAVDDNWLIWNAGLWEVTASGTYYWAEESIGFVSQHKKFGSGAKGKDFLLTLTCLDSKDMKLVFLKLYWRALPPPA